MLNHTSLYDDVIYFINITIYSNYIRIDCDINKVNNIYQHLDYVFNDFKNIIEAIIDHKDYFYVVLQLYDDKEFKHSVGYITINVNKYPLFLGVQRRIKIEKMKLI